MRNKKLLSTVVAGALVATMAMPVMAADGGGFDVTVTTKTPVIRVVVPTSMQIAVNQFEMGDTGSQIYSNAFEMENKSEIPVKMSVTSTATVPNTTTLVATKAGAVDSTTEGEAWLAVAAQTSADNYIETAGKTIADLTEASPNVTTFAVKDSANKAEQTFYLNASSTMKYKLLNANESAADIQYAQFYKLTPKTFTGADDNAKTAELKALVADEDVYYIATTSVANGAELNKLAKGSDTSSLTYVSTNTYYQVELTPTAKASIAASDLYVYGNGDTHATEGKAAFRYIGQLSGKQDSWSDTDLSQISVAYNILGVQQSGYDTLKAQTGALTYGLYKDPVPATSSAAEITVPATGNATAVVTVGRDGAEPSSLTTDWFDGDMFEMTDGWGASYDEDTKTITFDTDISDALRSDTSHTFTVTFTPTTGATYTQELDYTE